MRRFIVSTLVVLGLFLLPASMVYGNHNKSLEDFSIYTFPTTVLQVPCPGGAGVIGGHAFQDFNYNGLDDQLGAGLAGLEVYLFTCGLSGESELVETAITDLNGDYFFSNLVDGQEYRVEFSIPETQSFLESGFNATDSRTSVQFVTSPSCDINIGMANPDDYCEDDPKLIIPCYVNGDPLASGSQSATEEALVCFNTSYEGTRPAPTKLAIAQEIGSTWGITYNKKTETIYTSAVLKRHVGLGTLGIGGIYKIDMSGADPVVEPFIDLNQLGANIGTYASNSERGLSADVNLPSNDPQAFDDVGKKGLGSMTMSRDGNTLYVISLTDKTLYEVDISNGAPSGVNLKSYPIPEPNCTGGNFRPFALQIHNGKIYVGGVCDAETSQQKSDLRSIIYRLDGTTFTEVLNFSLDFKKGLASRSCDDDRGWFPWTNQMPEGCFISGSANVIVHPTPVLSDIEFDADGNMVIGYTDRIGNQVGYLNYGPTGQSELYSAFTGGDILKAAPNTDGSFTIENNGTVGPHTTIGAGNEEGPGGGEFFSFDVFEVAPNIPRPHSETAQGGLALIKGGSQVIGTALDPFGTFVNSGGVNYWNLETGEVRNPGYVVFRSSSSSISSFSKANGLGDIATLCGAAPIELGGRIWEDTNTNGVQDPCEGVFANIEISLYDENDVAVGTTTTDSNGEYFFNPENIGGEIQPNSNYLIVIGSAEQTSTPLVLLDKYTSTARDIGMAPNNDLNDSDVEIGKIDGIVGSFFINITTGDIGSVSHGNDAGFFEIPPPPVGNITGLAFNDTNKDGLQDVGEPVVSGVSVTLFNTNGVSIAVSQTDENGMYIFAGILAGDYYVEIDYETNIDGTIVDFDGTQKDAGDDNLDSDFDPISGRTDNFSFDPAKGDQDFDAGIFQPQGSLTGIAFEDLDKDGIQDIGELGISGMPVVLQDCAGETINSVLTDANGRYQFDNLFVGQIQVFFQSEVNDKSVSNFRTSPMDVGGDDNTDSDIDPVNNTSTCFSFDPKVGASIDAGFSQPTGAITGLAFDDKNGDGVRDPNEGILAGVTVRLQDCNGQPIASTTTDSNGSYSFGDILKASYQVVFDVSTNINGITNYQTSPQGSSSEINPSNNTSECFFFEPDKGKTVDAGFFQPTGTITGIAFEDLDGDGIQDPNEGFLAGVSVHLEDCNGVRIATTLTDTNGNYSFGDILLGDYRVVFDASTNDKGVSDFQTSPKGNDSDINAGSNASDCIAFDPAKGVNIDAGFFQPTGAITGIAFEDIDGDGIQDPNELGLANITVTLMDCNGNAIATTLTDSNGNYSFGDLNAGTYQVAFDASTNSKGINNYNTSPQDQGNNEQLDSDVNTNTNASDCITFSPDQGAEIDAGFFEPKGSITGIAFNDLDNDGTFDEEEFELVNVEVHLLDCNGNTLATSYTDESGRYTFDEISAGNYQILFNPNTNNQGIADFQSTIQGPDSDIDPTTNTSSCFGFEPEKGTEINVGFVQPTGTISGIAFDDVDGDGIRDPNEGLLAGVTVHLQTCDGQTIATTQTDSNGNYSFGDLVLGNYRIVFDVNTNSKGIADYQTSPQGTDSDINPTTHASDCVNFDPSKGENIDAGFFQPTGAISGIAFEDLDGDGIQDPNERGLANTTVSLMDCSGTVIATTVTDANGNYSFGDLKAGNYQVLFDASTNSKGIDNFKTSPQDQGGNDQTDSDINASTNTSNCIAFSPEQGANIDAGFFEPKGSLTGIAFNDLDGDGIQDPGELPLANVEVQLLDCSGAILLTTFTDQNGNYSFDGISAGNYQVRFSPTTNNLGITDFETSPKGVDSDIDPATNSSACISFDPELGEVVNAGFVQPAGIIEGTVFNDLDGDGMQEPGEGPIAGVTVSLMDCNGVVIATTTTDNNGNYFFADIKRGNYQVVFNPATNNQNISDFQTTFQDRGEDDMDSDIDPTDNTSDCISFDPKEGANIDAGFIQPKGDIIGTAFMDKNEDGMQGAGEFGIAGVTVSLIDATTNSIVATTTTNENGNYLFSDVTAGNYIISINPSTNSAGISDYIFTSQDMGNDRFDSDFNPSDGRSNIISFIPSEGADLDVGLYQPAEPVRIGNLVFKDCNQNGLFEVGEVGLAQFTVMLSGTNDLGESVNLQTETNQFGLYEFVVPRPGTYQLMFILPADLTGVQFSPKDIGDDSKDSDVDPTTGIVPAFTISSGDILDNVDVGIMDVTEPRLFNVPPDMTVDCNNIPDPPVSVKAVDNCDPSVVVRLEEQQIPALCGYQLIRTWSTIDDCGNTAERSQTLTVMDEEAPVITLSNPLLAGIPNGGEVTFDCDLMPEFDEMDVIVTDNCDTSITVIFEDLIREDGNCETDGYVVKMTCGWTAIDDCGNSSEYLIVINVVDTKAPTLTNIPADMTINLEDGQAIPEVDKGIVGTDNCDETVSISFEQTQTEGGPCGYDLIRTWTAKDNCGNKDVQAQKIRVLRNCECPEFLTDGRMVLDAACDNSMGGMILLNLTADARYYEFDYLPNLGTPNLLGNSRTDLPPGNYAITITYKGAENCQETLNIAIGTMDGGAVTVADRKKADCFQANGVIALSPANYTYVWSDGIVASQRGDLAAGSYKVNYTDDAGCQGSTTVEVEQPSNCPCLNFKLSVDQNNSPSCPGMTDGSVIVNTIGGKDGVQYKWNTGAIGASLVNIPAGQYTVTATDGTGCQIEEEIMVMNRESIMATIDQGNGVCGESGIIDLFVSGGVPPYTYAWNTGATTQDILKAETGIYEVTITDANACQTTAFAMVNNDVPIAIQLSKQLPSCAGSTDGKIFATVSGGTGNYTYQWSNTFSTKDNESVAAGAYSLVVTDESGCQEMAQIEVEEPDFLDVIFIPNVPNCGDNTASIDIEVTGGTAPYTYKWDTGSTNNRIFNLPSDNYEVTVTDANGCESARVINIKLPEPIAISISSNSPVCSRNLDELQVNVSGGVAPYTYQWNNGKTSDYINVPAGDYTVTVTDAEGCFATMTTTVVELLPVQVLTTATEAGCGGKGGDVTVTVNNGMPPFIFNWANGATTKDLKNVPAGVYEGIVTDANGCSALALATVTSSANIEATASALDPTCADSKNGAVYVTVKGGTAPLQYLWNTGETTKDLVNIDAGKYSLTITDGQNCNFVTDAILTAPAALSIAETGQTSAICEASDGSLTIDAKGGTAPYTYLWNNGVTTNQLEKTTAGAYQVTVTDSKGCIVSRTFTLQSDCTCPEPLYTNIMINNANCGNSDGMIMIMVDQIERYTFEWLPNIGTKGTYENERSSLPAGEYRVRVTYAGQEKCSEILDIFLGNNEAEKVETITNIPADCEQANGQVELSPKESIYTWPDGLIGYKRTDLTPGAYAVTAMDVNGCMQMVDLIVGQRECIVCDLSADIAIVKAPTCNFKRGDVSVKVTGGTAPYTYQWSKSDIGNNAAPTNLLIDKYEVTVTDANNCQAISTVTLAEPTCTTPAPACQVTASVLTVNIKCAGETTGAANVEIIDGKTPVSYAWSNGSNKEAISEVPAGKYTVTITDATGCSVVEEATILEPSPIVVSHDPQFFDCDKVAINMSIQGGTGPYQWICEGQEGKIEDALLLAPGTYTCTVMDNNWCSVEQSISIPAITEEACQPVEEEETAASNDIERPDFMFTSFEIQSNGTFASLKWSTKHENYTGSFVIGHSTDGVEFKSIEEAIKASGPAILAEYQSTLKIPNFGTNYFKIKYIDAKGDFVYSEVREVFRDTETAGRVLLYPNPIQDQFTIDFLKPTTKSKQVFITDNLGTVVEQLLIPSGTVRYELNAANYQPGLYILTIDNQLEKDVTLRLVKIEK